jgi:hypothetical protein
MSIERTPSNPPLPIETEVDKRRGQLVLDSLFVPPEQLDADEDEANTPTPDPRLRFPGPRMMEPPLHTPPVDRRPDQAA